MFPSLELLIAAVAGLSGLVAAVSGFGIGSLLTPAFALSMDIKLAVAAVAIPHLMATATRFWLVRRHVDRSVVINFGLTSAAGGLTGALCQGAFTDRSLYLLFGGLMIFAGLTGLTGLSQRMRFGRRVAWLAGLGSGMLGGLVGNQGGIRSAALLGFDLPRHAFVATATAIGLVVDLARIPVYIAGEGQRLLVLWPLITIACAATLAGTWGGTIWLNRLSESWFRGFVSVTIFVLGVYMLFKAIHP